MINKLIAIIKKNFKQLIGSKSSSLIIILGPLLLILVTGLALSNAGLRDINVGLYSPEQSELNQILLSKIQDSGFSVNVMDNILECKNSVKEGYNHICVEIKPRQTELSKYDPRVGYEAVFYVDYSKVRLVWAIINSVRNIVDKESVKISNEIIDKISKNIEFALETFEKNKGTLNEAIDTGEFVKTEVSNLRTSMGSVSVGQDIIIPLESSLDNQRIALNNLRNVVNFELAPVPGISQSIFNINTYITDIENQLSILETNLIQLKSILESRDIINRDARSLLLDVENRLDENLKDVKEARSQLNKLEGELEGIKNIKAKDIINPIPISITPVTGGGEAASISNALTYLDYLFPSITALIIIFVAILLSTTLTMKERKSIAHFRNIISPTNNYLFLLGLYIFCFILIVLQVLILFSVGKLFFNLNITSNLLIVSLILFLFISLLIFLGFMLGYLFNSEETAIVGSVSLSIFMLIASSLILPIETMPKIIGSVIKFNPFVVTETALRQVLIFDLPLSSVLSEIIILVVYTLLFAIASYFVMKFSKKEI